MSRDSCDSYQCLADEVQCPDDCENVAVDNDGVSGFACVCGGTPETPFSYNCEINDEGYLTVDVKVPNINRVM